MSDPRQRAIDLLSRMTLEEKAAQLTSMIPTALFNKAGIRSDVAQSKLCHGIGYLEPHAGGFPASAANLAKLNNDVQRYLVENTRLGIPAIMHVEALNGVNGPTFTCFPTAISLAATWNPGAVGEMADLTRRQMRATGLHQALSPLLDVARDARWGRVHETYGEDPYLVSAFGVSFIEKLQGLSLADGVLATGKHFLGYAVTDGGLNMATSSINYRDMLEVHARPFAAAISLSGLKSVMNSLSEWDGIPAAADPRLFRELLRDTLGFDGTVVSDWSSIANLVKHHRAARDEQEAGILALEAGIDVELPDPVGFGNNLVTAVREGKLAENLVDEAVARVLREKFALGLFDNPYVDEDPIRITEIATEGADLSLRLARESITLLKNERNLLPLEATTLKIAVVGPHARITDAAFPPYTFPSFTDLTRSMLSGGLSSMVGVDDLGTFGPDPDYIEQEVGPLLKMSGEQFAREQYNAVSLAEAVQMAFPEAVVTAVDGCGIFDGGEGIAEAVRAAEDAEIVILAVGGRARWFFGERTEGEGADASDIALPAVQRSLVEAVSAVGKPTVGVVFSGRPIALGDVEEKLDAIVLGYYGGPFGTQATAEVLAGIVNPQGRLPYTIPRHSGQVPLFVGQRYGSGYRRPTGDPMGGYVDSPATPLFAFGHGLSYSRFEYSDLRLSAESVPADGVVTVTATISNTGDRPGTEVAQIYVEDTATGIARPALQLAGFQAVMLEPGESTQVEFTLNIAVLGYLGRDGNWIVEPGPITVFVGPASDALSPSGRIELTGETADVTSRRVYLTPSKDLRQNKRSQGGHDRNRDVQSPPLLPSSVVISTATETDPS